MYRYLLSFSVLFVCTLSFSLAQSNFYNQYINPKLYDSLDKKAEWISNNAIKINTLDLISPNDDLLPLKKHISNCKVVALGEVTHGSGDIYMMKDRIIKFLVEECGFTIFVLEGLMPQAYKLNEYIIGGNGNPIDLVNGLEFWCWQTKEMLDLVLWMKQYNDTHTKKIQFTGVDMNDYEGAYNEIENLLNRYHVDSTTTLLIHLKTYISVITENKRDNNSSTLKQKKDVNNIGERIIQSAKQKINNAKDEEWLTQNIRLLNQYANKTNGWLSKDRDSSMAENLFWIMNNNPDAKCILWAHNYHIEKKEGRMGGYIKNKLKHDYYSIGSTFFSGTYTAISKNGLNTIDATPAFLGTYEYVLHATNIPYFFLSLKDIDKNNDSRWFNNTQLFRQIGLIKMDGEFYPVNIATSFDMIMYSDHSTPSILLKNYK